MKIVYLCALIFLVSIGYAKGQNCCPYIGNIIVLPATPTENDPIQIALDIQTPNPSKKVSITHSVIQGTVHINACYAVKSAAGQVNIFMDTLYIGKLSDGFHNIIVHAYWGTDLNSCIDLFDSTTRTDTFEVLPIMPITQTILPKDITEEDSVKIAVTVLTPNPAKKVSLVANVFQNNIIVNGCFSKKDSTATAQLFTDTISIGKLPEGKYRSVFTAYYSDGVDTNLCNSIVDSTQTADSVTVANGLAIIPLSLQKDRIYPNPAFDKVHIELPVGSKLDRVVLQDMSGRSLKDVRQNTISVSDLESGLYMLRIRTDTGEYIHKLQKY